MGTLSSLSSSSAVMLWLIGAPRFRRILRPLKLDDWCLFGGCWFFSFSIAGLSFKEGCYQPYDIELYHIALYYTALNYTTLYDTKLYYFLHDTTVCYTKQGGSYQPYHVSPTARISKVPAPTRSKQPTGASPRQQGRFQGGGPLAFQVALFGI